MDNTMWIWIVVGIVVLVVLIGLLAMLAKGSKQKKIEHDRAEAERMRVEATEHERKVREAKADATATDADARLAQAEADRAGVEAKRRAAQADQEVAEAERRRVDAERLQDDARAKSDDVHHAERAHDEQLRAADAKDPDVLTNEDGRRVEEEHRATTQPREGDNGRDRTAPGAGVAGAPDHGVPDRGVDRGVPDRGATTTEGAYAEPGQTERPVETSRPVETARPVDGGGRDSAPDDVWSHVGRSDVSGSEEGREQGEVQPAQADATEHDRPGFTDKDRGKGNRLRGTDEVDGPPAR